MLAMSAKLTIGRAIESLSHGLSVKCNPRTP
jgi:hypothetical protein